MDWIGIFDFGSQYTHLIARRVRELGVYFFLELRKRNAYYIVGTPKSHMNKIESDLTEKDWQEVEHGVEVKFINSPDDIKERFILCRSKERTAKEKAIFELQKNRLEEKLKKVQASIQKGKLKNPITLWMYYCL